MTRIKRCAYPGCRTHLPTELVYYDRPLCARHWAHIASLKPGEAKAILNIREKKDTVKNETA